MKRYVRELILFGIAAVLAGVILAAGCREPEKEYVYDIVFLGDSIVGNGSITDILEERLGKTVYNGALGGSCMSVNHGYTWESIGAMEWSMVRLAQAIYGDDFTSPLAAVTYAEEYRPVNMLVLNYFYERIRGLSQMDFSKTRILLIEHGTNDYNCGQPVDNEENPMDSTTFGGALRTTLTLLQEKYPDLRIILISPIYCEIDGIPCYEGNLGGGILDEFVQKEQEIAQEFQVEWLDMYRGSGIWEDNAEDYLYDGLHLTEAGIALIGNQIADYLEESSK